MRLSDLRLDAYKRIGDRQRGQKCGRGWVGLKGACQRAKKGADKGELRKRSAQDLANKIRAGRGLKSREAANRGREKPIWTEKEFRRRLERKEDDIREQDFETLVVYDKKRREILSFDGDEDSVDIPPDSYGFFKDAVITHNHPLGRRAVPGSERAKGNSFSDADIEVATGLDVAELRAVSPGWRHVLKRPKNGWGDPNVSAKAFAKAEATVRRKFQAMIDKAEDSAAAIDYAEGNHNHERTALFAKAIGAEYTREKWEPRR